MFVELNSNLQNVSVGYTATTSIATTLCALNLSRPCQKEPIQAAPLIEHWTRLHQSTLTTIVSFGGQLLSNNLSQLLLDDF